MIKPVPLGISLLCPTALAGLLGQSAWPATPIVNLPKPDTAGWIQPFRGNNASDFYSYMGNNFKQPFSHYRVQFQLMWPGNIGNTGLLNKVQDDDTAQSEGFPRSIECQGDPNQGLRQIWHWAASARTAQW